MEKSYNDIKAQERRIISLCIERNKYCDNAKNRLDMQRIAQLTRNTLSQHGFPIFGIYDHNERRPFMTRNLPKSKPIVRVEEANQVKEVAPQKTPTEIADDRMKMDDWLRADKANRYKIQNVARHQFMNRMYAELLFDMEVCKIEGWDIFEYPKMLRDSIAKLLPQTKQLTLF